MPSEKDALRYIRAKVDQLLAVIGTLPLRPEELDDDMLIELDPIGIVADSFTQVIAHLNTTNHRLDLATREIRAIFDTLGAAVLVLDLHNRIEDCNRQALDWLFDGAARDRIIGRPAADMAPLAGMLAAIGEAANELPRIVAIGARDLQLVSSRILDETGSHAKTVVLFTDITQQKENARHLELYARIFSDVGEGILITDADNRIVEVNAAVSRITGFPRDELIGTSPAILKSGLHEPAFYEAMWHALRQTGRWHGETLNRARDGRIVPVLQTISEVRDADGALTHHISVMTDISSIKETQSRLDFLAHHDALTELPNRLLFGDRLQHLIARAVRNGDAVALLFIDLDHFKNINDSLGHHVGDQLLVEAAQRLRSLVRRSDTLARLGGDEFVVLMEDQASHAAAVSLADKIVTAFKQPFQVGGIDLHVRCSIGITLYPEDGADAITLLKNADTAMYRAKDAGRDGHVRYNAELSAAARSRIELDRALRAAVQDGGFALHYQPIVDIAHGRVIACEALIRWPGGPAGARTPDVFIPLAEENRLIVPLGEWILREALASMRTWRSNGLKLDYISVNISAVQLAQPDFADRVIALLQESGLPGQRLQIELTENVLLRDIELCGWVLSQLREHGIRVAIDDFGTGYSSLSYLKQLPIDNLKIDRSFVRDIPTDANDCAIATAIIALASSLGLDAIAEGIETSVQQTYLAQIGCTKVQGFLHSEPVAADAFAAFASRLQQAHPDDGIKALG
ncbi:putative bifunctional diguanylate cyclase/phosphodiesterase [Thiobacillus sedimenti]|uniref:EAL domain-containing protein n=1 Tax=Thiobacillus sedimenti TaxID=3110231 RepID=A0ABZ1CGS4_9PROT|nr:EAL domain-containing protein [Thiobacillus sp. SCUT-2]WRS38111.1 EAL domain-containing protein [Thiobacillus sp. SCUT-2]